MKRRVLISAHMALASAVLMAACGRSGTTASSNRLQPHRPRAVPAPPKMPDVGIYVTNETSGTLTVIDGVTLTPVTTIALGKRPRGIAVSPTVLELYVALSGSPNAGPGVDEKTLPPPDRTADGIGVVDLAQGKLIKVLTSGPDPEQVAVSPDGAHVRRNEDAAKASVVDVNTGQIVESFSIGEEPEGVSVEPHNGRLWVTSEEDGASVRDRRRGAQGRQAREGWTEATFHRLSPRRLCAYVPSETGASLTVIDVKKLAPIKTINLGTGMRPMGTAVAPSGQHLYVSTGRSKVVLDSGYGDESGHRIG